MPSFDSAGVEIAYDSVGSGTPILLLHGFAATRADNWVRTGWYGALEKTRRQVIAFDHRGHGESEKLYEPADYSLENMTGDAVRLLDHLGIERAELMGYSMGAGLGLRLLIDHPDRFSLAVLAGIGGRMLTGSNRGAFTADALESDTPDAIEDRTALGFRRYAEGLGQDLKALAACARAPRGAADAAAIRTIKTSTLVIAGQRDDLAGDPGDLADIIPGAKAHVVPGVDHMFLLPNGAFKGAVIDFLTGWS